jgi:hypothetical protein
MGNEIFHDTQELRRIADLLAEEIKGQDRVVSRYIRVSQESVTFVNGKNAGGRVWHSGINKEGMADKVYTQTSVDELRHDNFPEVAVSRDLQKHRFNFSLKGAELPAGEAEFIETIPPETEMYDKEFQEFTRTHKNTRIRREFFVEQKVIVNSRGGRTIQSLPFFEIGYSHSYDPLKLERNLRVVCASREDARRLIDLIKFMPDPTPDKRIKNARSFSEAFHELHMLSKLGFGSLEDAGIPIAGLYDIVMLNGFPAHEIFGHHFEEPIRFLEFGESATFKHNQELRNKNIVLMDNPQQEIGGFKVQGFTYIDAYGRRRQARTHIKDGRVMEFLGSEYCDPEGLMKYLGVEKSRFVGQASQYLDQTFPQPRMSCTVLDGKTENVDLEGQILIVPCGGHTDPDDKTYTVVANECYVIRNGEAIRVVPLKVTGGINQALENVTLLNDLNYNIGACEKKDPLYPKIESNVPVSQVVRSQIWRGQQAYPLAISEDDAKVLTR